MSLRLLAKSLPEKPETGWMLVPVQAGELTASGKTLDARFDQALSRAGCCS